MLTNFIYAKSKALFEQQLEAGNILDEAIVFIEDTKEIWNHGTYFAGEGVNVNDFNNLQTEVSELSSNLDNYIWKTVKSSDSGWTINIANENTFYYNTSAAQLRINSFENSGSDRGLYKFAFKAIGNYSITLPEGVYWANGAIPEVVANTYYELSIERSCGIYKAILVPFIQIV